jgi:hypothetical protein
LVALTKQLAQLTKAGWFKGAFLPDVHDALKRRSSPTKSLPTLLFALAKSEFGR